MPATIPFGTAEQVSVIDKVSIQPAICVFLKERLSVVGMSGTNVDNPCQPEFRLVSNPGETRPRQDFQQAHTISAKEAGAEAQARVGSKTPLRGLQPAVWIVVQKGIGDQQRRPGWNRQTAASIKLAAHALVERQVGPLQVVGELGNVKPPVARLN